MLNIKYTKLAIQDLNDSYDYIFKDNPIAARNVIEKVELTVSKLAEFPHMGHLGRVDGTFEFVALDTPFVIIYMFDETTLKIVSILHMARRYP
ncbi:MAG: type II toxin-antitoxin system RelE/ParE family toxin [Acetobacter sp.]|nr:type II toxin-antitoxin system RelE/ParE family toxin [Acetobacter sp.]